MRTSLHFLPLQTLVLHPLTISQLQGIAASVFLLSVWMLDGDDFLVGSNLCGPICIEAGPQYYERSCFGVVSTTTVPDAYFNYCYGIPYDEIRCYGYPTLPDSVESWPRGPRI